MKIQTFMYRYLSTWLDGNLYTKELMKPPTKQNETQQNIYKKQVNGIRDVRDVSKSW